MKAFDISAEGLGVISGFYFSSYAPMQLPAGLLFDRYGPRKLMTIAIVVCVIGTLFFAATSHIASASFGRFLIGFGSAFSFIGVLVLISRWFPPASFAMMAGIAQMMSSVGAVSGQVPLAKLVEVAGWRNANYILAAVGLILAALLWTVIRDHPGQKSQQAIPRSIKEELHRLVRVCGRRCTWIIGLYAFSIWMPIVVFAGLWGVSYLQVKFNTSVVIASSLCSMVWVGIGVGSPLLGWLSDRFSTRKLFLTLGAGCSLLASVILIYHSNLSLFSAYCLLFLFGLGAGGQALSFAVISDNNARQDVGTASGFNNLSVLLGGAIFQPVVGFLLHDDDMPAKIVNGIHIYPLNAYQLALMIIPISYLCCLLVSVFLLKESYPKHRLHPEQ